MTNREKFIKVMNEYFGAELTEENFNQKPGCTPCGLFREGACGSFSCKGCKKWWDKEWTGEIEDPNIKNATIEVIPCTKIEEATVKDWLAKIDEKLNEFKAEVTDKFLFYDRLNRDYSEDDSYEAQWSAESIAQEAADVITAITSMLEAMGIDKEMRNKAQKEVNKRNFERGRICK